MSKAFTKEDDAPGPELPAAPAIAPGELRLCTPEGYAALSAELARLDPASRRAQQLAATLPLLTVKTPSCERGAAFGCWVEVEDEDGARRSYRLVGPDEVDAKSGLISAASPLGRALLGKLPGDEVAVELPQRTAEYTVVAVRAAQE